MGEGQLDAGSGDARSPDFRIGPIAPQDPPWDLLLDADPEREMVLDYWPRGRAYGMWQGSDLVAEAVFLPTRPLTWELANVAVKVEWRRQGLARELITRGLEDAERVGMRVVEVGTADASPGPLQLYLSMGFRIVGVDLDFFTRLYRDPVIDSGRRCRDMIRLARDLPAPRLPGV
jgi:GNAT superfamily N-acetyltransferase